MPGKIGVRELARLAKEKLPSLKVLFTSGYTQNAIVHNGRLDEGVELLSKPYRKDELARKLRQMLDGTDRRSSAQPVQNDTKARTSADGSRNGKVLIVEDSSLIRMTTVEMVSELGFATAEAGDAADALGVLAKDPEIRILLTDLGLAGMSGAELASEARKLKPDLMVVAVSGYSEETGRSHIEGAGYLQKPFTLEQLRAVLAG
jgi:CheY-like chemotaxis protein